MNNFAYLNELDDSAELIYRSTGSTAIKVIGDPTAGRIGGYLVVWGSPQQRDLQGEYFTQETDLGLDWYDKRPVLYHHGLDGELKTAAIGVIDTLKSDQTGLWAEAQLDLHKRYKRHVQQVMGLVDQGVLGWSSGSLPHLVEVDTDGCIKRWPIVEGSMTPAPAQPVKTTIGAIKSALADDAALLAEEFTTEEPVVGKAEGVIPTVQPIPTTSTEVKMDPREMLLSLLTQLLASKPEWQLTPEEQAAMVDQVLAQMQTTDATMSASIAPDALATVAGKAAAFIFNAASTLFTARAQQAAATENALKMAMNAQLAIVPPPAPAGAAPFTGNGGNGGHSEEGSGQRGAPMQISDFRLRSKFANLSPEDQSFIVDTYTQYAFKNGQRPVDMIFTRQTDKEAAIKTFMLELADKVVEGYRKNNLYVPNDAAGMAHAIKSMAAKTNELDHTTQANFGQEWVHTIWRDQIWEKARLENVVLSQFESIEMAAKTEEFPLESTDPDVEYVGETTDDSQLDPSSTGTSAQKIGTGKKQFSAKKLKLRVGWSAEEDEDSIIKFADQSRKQADRAMRNAIDFVMLNGDIETGTTNINLDGAAPGAKSKYLAFDGLIKMALVTGAAQKLDASGAAVSLTSIRQTRFLMGREQAPQVDDIVLFTHIEGYSPMLGIDQFLTMDKVGALATALKGQLGVIDGMPVLVTAQMLPSYSNGKVSNTGNLNTKNRYVVVYKPNWKVGFRRKITPTLEFLAGPDAWQLHLSTRLDFKSSTQDSAALLYNGGS